MTTTYWTDSLLVTALAGMDGTQTALPNGESVESVLRDLSCETVTTHNKSRYLLPGGLVVTFVEGVCKE
jgi:hypothetical protein